MNIQILSRRFCDHSTFIRGYAPPTVQRYKQGINFLCKYAGVSEIEEVNKDNMRELFYYGRTQRNWSAGTFITYHKTYVVFFRWCVENGHMVENPAEDMELPKKVKKLPSKLTKQEAMKLLEIVYNRPSKYKFLRYRNHAMFATFIFVGLRKKELLNLKFADVDLENMSIFIRQGKGNKDRILPICSRLEEILRKYLKERYRLNRTCPEFFASLNHNLGFTESGMKHLVEKLQKISKVKFTIHKLRHTFATLMLEGGCDIYSLSRMMGHSDIKTTTIYLSASAEHLRSQIIKHPLNDL